MNTSTIITADVVEDLLKRAVAERGSGYRYPNTGIGRGVSCHYRWDTVDLGDGLCTTEQVGKPACVVGQVFDYAGVLSDLIPEWALDDSDEDYQPSDRFFSNNDEGIDDLMDRFSPSITPLAHVMLREAQSAQDGGSTWGTALHRARKFRQDSDLPDVLDVAEVLNG